MNDKVTEAEREFYKAFVTILDHLHKRAAAAEAQVRHLQHELEKRREQVEFYSLSKPHPSPLPAED